MIGVEIGRYLGANVPGLTWSETSAANIAMNEMPTGPDHIVTIVDTGGPESDSSLPYDEFHLQLVIRSDASSPQWALEMWDTLFDFLHGKRNFTLSDGTLVIYCLVRQGNPVSIGTDDNDRHTYTMNLRGETYHPTAERP
jgi:hypothetical protein